MVLLLSHRSATPLPTPGRKESSAPGVGHSAPLSCVAYYDCLRNIMSMKQIADWALNTVTQRGAGYADIRIVDHRQRSLATKNGKVGHAGSAETLGIGIRVLVNDAWGFA